MATITIADLDHGKRDLQTVSEVANSRAATATTRFGQQTTTLYEAIRRVGEKSDAILRNLGFFRPVDYTPGLSVETTNFTVKHEGVVYAAQPGAVPFTTGAWDAEQWYPLQNIYSDHNLLVFDTYVEASAAAATLPDGQTVDVDSENKRYKVLSGALVFFENIDQLRQDLSGVNGAGLVGYTPAGTGAVATTVQSKLREMVSVKDFGAIGDGVADDTAAIQAAINYAIYQTKIGEVHFGSGIYKTTDTIHLGYGTSFTSVTLIGSGSKYRGDSNFSGTAIVPAFSDRPAIAVQGGRRVVMKDLSLIGVNYSFVSAGDFGGLTSSIDDTSLSVWLSPSLNANANSRYAPYAGIAIDPYSGTAPTPAYPNVTFPSFIGSPGQYNKSFTDTVIVSNCYIAGFVVGAVIQPCNADGNGDFVSFRDTLFEYLPYGISAGNSQGREVNAINCGFRNVHTCVTNNKHGKQIGKLGGNHSGTHYDRVIQIYDLDTSYSGPIAFTGCYGELVWRLGSVNTPVTRSTHLQVASSELRFTDHPATRGIPATLTANNHTIDFIGGSIQLGSIATGSINFDGTKVDCVDCTSVTPSTARKNAQQVSGGVLPLSTQIPTDPSKFLRHTLVASVTRNADRIAVTSGRANAISRIARFARHADTTKVMPTFGCPSPVLAARNKASVTASFSGITGTLDFTSSYSAIFPFKISAGDLIQDDQTGTVFLVESVTSAVATVTALNNYKNSGSGNVFRDAVSTTVGNWYVLNTRLYGTTYPLFGDITSGSAVITNIGRGDSYAAFASTDLAVGDYIWQDDWQGRLFPNGATISAIDTTARTITMSGVATKTQAGILLPFWVRA